MSAPLDALQAHLFYRRKRRVELLRSGGTAAGVADEVFRVPGTLLAPITALVAGDGLANAMLVSKHTADIELRGELFGTTSNGITLNATIAGTFTLTANGFGTVGNIEPAIPFTADRHIIVLAADIDNTRLAIFHNGVIIHNATNAGFTSWATAADTFEFGSNTDLTSHHSAEVYLRRLPPGL